jgi:hypothetical protein
MTIGKLNWSFVNSANRSGIAPHTMPPTATTDLNVWPFIK